MRPVPKPRLFCQVDRKTGTVLDGPRELPQKWGNVSGFNHLKVADLKRYDWFPLAEFTQVHPDDTVFALVFLPEKEVVVKVKEQGARGLRDFAVAHLNAMYHYRSAQRDVKSDILGPEYWFPNTVQDQIIRLQSVVLNQDYTCVARNDKGVFEPRILNQTQLIQLIEDIHHRTNGQLMDKFVEGLTRIYAADEQELRALLDTDMAEIYDD